jgi:hypothetical protein
MKRSSIPSVFHSCAMLVVGVFLLTIGCHLPAFAQDSSVETAVAASSEIVIGEPSKAQLESFKKQITKQVEQQFRDGEINRIELMRAKFTIKYNQAKVKELHQEAAEQVLLEGKASSYAAIDWEKLAMFIKEIMPLILQLIQLFSWSEPPYYMVPSSYVELRQGFAVLCA